MKWKTSISTIKNGQAVIRGKKIVDLVSSGSFSHNAYFVITGRIPTPEQAQLLDNIFSISLDHGAGTVSTTVARIATSAHSSLQQVVAAAIASMGHRHGGATEDAARWLQKNVSQSISAEQAVQEALNSKVKIPGYGHAVLTEDERATFLFGQAKELKLFGHFSHYAIEVGEQLNIQKGKKVPLNVDGAIAALALDLEIPVEVVTGLFIIGRLPGLLAHVYEEYSQNNDLRRIPEEEIDYTP